MNMQTTMQKITRCEQCIPTHSMQGLDATVVVAHKQDIKAALSQMTEINVCRHEGRIP
jgi:hypothetical protein